MKNKCVNCFKSLSAEARTKIYMSLRESSKNENAITSMLGLKQPTVSYHLQSMVDSGLLNVESKGHNKIFSVNSVCPHDDSSCILKS